MTIDELKESISNDIDSRHFKLQAIFDRHLSYIESLNESGMTHKKILELLEIEVSYKHFINLLSRSRNKKKLTPKYKEQDYSSLVIEGKKTKTILDDQTDTKKWEKVGVRSDYLIKKLMSLNITPEQVKDWKCSNEMQIIKRATETKRK
jgi:hypothetical protein